MFAPLRARHGWTAHADGEDTRSSGVIDTAIGARHHFLSASAARIRTGDAVRRRLREVSTSPRPASARWGQCRATLRAFDRAVANDVATEHTDGPAMAEHGIGESAIKDRRRALFQVMLFTTANSSCCPRW